MAEETILIIEDEQHIATMLDGVIRERGYRPLVAHDGLSGFDLALQERPDLILLDLRLPQMSGVELLARLNEHQLNLPVVVVTALGSEELALHALRMGVKDYIKKPFDLHELVEVVERALEQGRLRRENERLVVHLRASRDQVAERSTDLKTVLNKLVRLQRMSLALSALTIGADLRDVYKQLTEYAARLLEVKSSAILLFDSQRQELVCQEPAFGISAATIAAYRIPLTPKNPVWDAWQQGQSLMVNDVTASPLAEPLALGEQAALEHVRATMFSALRMGGRSTGLFQVSDKLDGSGFSLDDQRVLEIFASQCAIAIENARLFTSEKRRASEMAAVAEIAEAVVDELHKISNMINSTLELDKVFDEILHGAMSITTAPCASILVLDEEHETFAARTRRGDQTQVETLAPAETALMIPDSNDLHAGLAAGEETPWLPIFRRLLPEARSLLCVPIVSGSARSLIGLLSIASPLPGEFGPDDRRLLEALANQAAIAIQNGRYLEAMRRYQEQQVEAERIAAMADVATNMVHRINNTVGAIRPLVQQIELRLNRAALDDDYLREKLGAIRKSADHTLEVARQIRLPFQSVRLEPIDVNVAVAAASADLKPPVGVDVHIEYGEDLPPVRATPQLNEVFRNLMTNALDAMSRDGGVLTVRNRRLNDRWVAVTVHDTGPGIPPQLRDKLFHMGATTKPGGSGFGLWWSRTFLRRLGGDIVLESHNGKGCLFTVTLPIHGHNA